MFMIPPARRWHREAAQGAGAAPAVLDEEALGRLRQLDPDGARGFLQQVLQTYANSIERHLQTLDEAARAQDIGRVGNIAHTLKSSSASVGALDLSQVCAQVERLAKAGDAVAMDEPMTCLRTEAQRVLLGVRAMLAA